MRTIQNPLAPPFKHLIRNWCWQPPPLHPEVGELSSPCYAGPCKDLFFICHERETKCKFSDKVISSLWIWFGFYCVQNDRCKWKYSFLVYIWLVLWMLCVSVVNWHQSVRGTICNTLRLQFCFHKYVVFKSASLV